MFWPGRCRHSWQLKFLQEQVESGETNKFNTLTYNCASKNNQCPGSSLVKPQTQQTPWRWGRKKLALLLSFVFRGRLLTLFTFHWTGKFDLRLCARCHPWWWRKGWRWRWFSSHLQFPQLQTHGSDSSDLSGFLPLQVGGPDHCHAASAVQRLQCLAHHLAQRHLRWGRSWTFGNKSKKTSPYDLHHPFRNWTAGHLDHAPKEAVLAMHWSLHQVLVKARPQRGLHRPSPWIWVLCVESTNREEEIFLFLFV